MTAIKVMESLLSLVGREHWDLKMISAVESPRVDFESGLKDLIPLLVR